MTGRRSALAALTAAVLSLSALALSSCSMDSGKPAAIKKQVTLPAGWTWSPPVDGMHIGIPPEWKPQDPAAWLKTPSGAGVAATSTHPPVQVYAGPLGTSLSLIRMPLSLELRSRFQETLRDSIGATKVEPAVEADPVLQTSVGASVVVRVAPRDKTLLVAVTDAPVTLSRDLNKTVATIRSTFSLVRDAGPASTKPAKPSATTSGPGIPAPPLGTAQNPMHRQILPPLHNLEQPAVPAGRVWADLTDRVRIAIPKNWPVYNWDDTHRAASLKAAQAAVARQPGGLTLNDTFAEGASAVIGVPGGRSFLLVWDARGDYQTPSELRQSLVSEAHAEAVTTGIADTPLGRVLTYQTRQDYSDGAEYFSGLQFNDDGDWESLEVWSASSATQAKWALDQVLPTLSWIPLPSATTSAPAASPSGTGTPTP